MTDQEILLFATEECELNSYLSEHALDDYFADYENQLLKFARTMYQKGSDDRLKKAVEWFREYPTHDMETYAVLTQLSIDFEKAMRPQQEES